MLFVVCACCLVAVVCGCLFPGFLVVLPVVCYVVLAVCCVLIDVCCLLNVVCRRLLFVAGCLLLDVLLCVD